jgi:hypothetical protein
MKKKSLGISLVVITTLSIGLSGCGGSSSSTPTTNSLNTGRFIDAPVYGLKYKTATQNGYTDINGNFKYKDGEKVEFFLNTLSLGEVNASALITPYTIAGDTNISNPSKKASNIALLLQNFDANKSKANIIDVSKFKDLGDYNLSNIDLNSTTTSMETEITNLLATGGFQQYVDDTNLTLVNTTTVQKKMETYTTYASSKNSFTTAMLSVNSWYELEYDSAEEGCIGKKIYNLDGTFIYSDNGGADISGTYIINSDGTFTHVIAGSKLKNNKLITATSDLIIFYGWNDNDTQISKHRLYKNQVDAEAYLNTMSSNPASCYP